MPLLSLMENNKREGFYITALIISALCIVSYMSKSDRLEGENNFIQSLIDSGSDSARINHILDSLTEDYATEMANERKANR
jgi:hypothetical protein